MKLPKSLGTVSDLVKRAEAAKTIWELWRSLHQEAFDFAAPQRDTFRFFSQGQQKNRHVFDSTAVDGLVKFANIIQGAVVPSWQQWMALAAGDSIPEEEKVKTDKALEYATDIFFKNLNHSNFSTEITPGLSDLGIGTGAILVEEGRFGSTEPVLRFCNVPLAELNPEMPAYGPIKNVWRTQEIEIRHIKTLWPEAEIPKELESKIKRDPLCKEKILNGMLYDHADDKYYQVVIWNKKTVLFVQEFGSQRLIVFRWHVTPGEVFGRGPIISKLADIRTLNKVKQFILENAAIQMAGVYTGRSDGIFNPHTVRIAPGSIIPVSDNGTGNPTLQALPRAGDIGIGNIVLENLQDGIRKALMTDPLGDITDPVRTATEQMIRNQENLKERGAAFGRLKSELVEPLVRAVVDILRSRGLFPNIQVDGKQATIRHVSPLAQAESIEDFQNSLTWFNAVSQLPEAVVMGSVKIEDLPKYWQTKLSISADLIRSEEERAELGQALIQTSLQGGIVETGTA